MERIYAKHKKSRDLLHFWQMVWSTMNVITTCNYRFQEVLYLINVRVRVRTGSSIGLPLATVYCGLNTNTYNELFTLSWDVNYCTHNFWNRLQHAIVQWISSYIQDVEKISVIYRGYRNLTFLSFGWMYSLIIRWEEHHADLSHSSRSAL